MKIRNGFVSNSSSSSFVIRGIEMRKLDVANKIGVEDPEGFEDMTELYDAIWNRLNKLSGYKIGSFTFEDTRDFFDGPETDTMIVGVQLVSLDDGCVTQLPEPDDDKVRDKICAKLGLNQDEVGALHTYVQYVSNDNY